MDTKEFKVGDQIIDSHIIREAAALLQKGELVAFPTETVYGLGADATNDKAVAKIFTAKGRPQDNPLIVHAASKEQLSKLVLPLPDYAAVLLERFSPGPITFVLPHKGTLSDRVTAGLPTVGVRIPNHPVALALIEESGTVLAAPSANTSGKPSPTTAVHVADDLKGIIAGIVDGGPTGVGVESTVVDCTGELPVILRPGGITQEMIEEAIGKPLSIPKETPEVDKPKSPGMKYRHYAPEMPLWLVEGSAEDIHNVLQEQQDLGKRVAILASNQTCSELDVKTHMVYPLGENQQQIAAKLYDGLRHFAETNVDLIICEAFSESGIGEAIMNRLRKAADRQIKL